MQHNDEFEPKTLVRSFSDRVSAKVNGDGTHSTALEKLVALNNHDSQLLRNWFEPQTADNTARQGTSLLEAQAHTLSETWKAFRSKLPAKEQATFESSHPSMEEVIQLMQQIGNDWDQNRKKGTWGKIKSQYRACCVKIKSHQNMLKIIPEDNEYCSLFTGVLKSIVFATANHERIALGLSKAILKINEIVARCEEACAIYPATKMQGFLMDLYGQVFLLLTEILEWYIQKKHSRVLKSFNEDLYDEFQAQILEIERKAEFLRSDGMLQGQSAEIRLTRLQFDALATEWRAEREEARRVRDADKRRILASEEGKVAAQQEFGSILVSDFKAFLEQVAKEAIDTAVAGRPSPYMPGASVVQSLDLIEGTSNSEVPKVPTRSYSRDDILAVSRDLEDHFDRDRVRIKFDATAVNIPVELRSTLQKWIGDKNSRLLSIAGPAGRPTAGPPEMSAIAATMIEAATRSGAPPGIPVISYFCQITRSKSRNGIETVQQRAFIAMIYALIRQTMELWPMESTPLLQNFDNAAFAPLDGSFASLPKALELLEDAFSQAPGILCCVVDGFQDVEHASTVDAVDAFLKFLRRHSEESSQPKVLFKILLTTSGRSRQLMCQLSREELVLADCGRYAMGFGHIA